MKTYEAVLISPNGDWITDFKEYKIKEVEEDLAIANSARILFAFYPYQFIIKSPKIHLSANVLKERIIEVAHPESLTIMKGLTVERAIKKIMQYR